MLDDAPGDQTARERFRQYLMKSVSTIGTVRDHTETCLRESGPQYSRALQDLVNHTARLLGFSVEFGRYQGVAGEIGYDGIWRFGDMTIVVEVKTTGTYAIDTATLTGYVDQLISAQRISDWDHTLGLYAVGRTDPGLNTLSMPLSASVDPARSGLSLSTACSPLQSSAKNSTYPQRKLLPCCARFQVLSGKAQPDSS